MTASSERQTEAWFLAKQDLNVLFDELHRRERTIIGPTIDQDAIVYAQIESVDDLPLGWTEEQRPGSYRLTPTGRNSYFDFTVGPQSWKTFLFPPRIVLSRAARHEAGDWRFEQPISEHPKLAFLGVRACELAAIQIQDRVFLSGPFVDTDYEMRRDDVLLIAVNCTTAAPTCFCTSMGTGPRCSTGFDLAMTELEDGFVVEVGSPDGRDLVDALQLPQATLTQQSLAEEARKQAEQEIDRSLDTSDIRELLLSNLDHPRWDDVADRCLSCTNCTMVCPTCFCVSVTEVGDLAGDKVERRRQWDSCFNGEFSYMNGGNVRNSIRSRYRQWLTHKLASWQDQFGESGCVGCGRCMTWCPVGIELTEEVAAIREEQP